MRNSSNKRNALKAGITFGVFLLSSEISKTKRLPKTAFAPSVGKAL
jgi:hypothetical protein